jgi:hypothetical protein
VSLTAQAEVLAEDAREIGKSAAWVNRSAWRAGVAPEATGGLVGAALALGGDPLASLRPVPPVPDDKTFIDVAEDLWSDARAMQSQARALSRKAEALLANTRKVPPGDKQAAKAAAQVAADCQCCLEILARLIPRLGYAVAQLETVPHDLETTYEAPYAMVRGGGQLPFRGDFLTGADVRSAGTTA